MQQLNIPITATTVKESIEQNPYYPSLYSLSNTFSKYKIDNVAFEAKEEQLVDMQTPFVAYIQTQATGKDFVLVTKYSLENVTYIAQGNKELTITQKEFVTSWKKIIFLAEGTATSGEKDYVINLKKERSVLHKRNLKCIGGLAIFGLAIATAIFSDTPYYKLSTIVLLTKILGVAVTTLLLVYEIDKSNAFVKNICTAGKQTNCDAVLNSGAARFLGMSWSEIGFFYFAGTLLFALMPGLAFVQKIPWLSFAAIAVSPYIPFSIYYQYKVVKQWCPLCLATQLVLAAELCWAVYTVANGIFSITPSSGNLSFVEHFDALGGEGLRVMFTIATSILLPILIWYSIKPLILSAKEMPTYKAAYKRLLYHPDTFNTTLQRQHAVDGWQNLGITIGNPQAPNTILKVCNPYCGPCAKAHPVLEELIHNNDNYKLQIIFTTKPGDSDEGKDPTSHLMAINALGDMQKTQKALDDWYLAPKKEYEAFAKKYPMNGELKLQQNTLQEMANWCNKAEIQFTPTIFINGKQLPGNYNVEELKYIL